MALLRPLQEISLRDLTDCGGKAARLGEAAQLGCPVLPGIVLTTALYHRYMRQGGLQGEIASILATMQPTTMTHFQAAEWAIRSAFGVRRIPDQVVETIREAWRSLGSVPLAVRSSATNEDSPQQSFVGQHATYLDVDSEGAAVEAVIGCWLSLYSAKALSYAQCFGVDLLASSMAVVMQPMVSPSSAGALFTVDPITGNPDVFVLEVQQGPNKGVNELDPYERKPGELPFWSQLRHLGLLLDEHLLSYQTIEWLIADERLYLLRVRPVTGGVPYMPLSAAEIGAGRQPLELIQEPGCTPRAARPYSWYHRSRSPSLSAAYFRSASRLFSPFHGREEFYPCGYLYACWQATPSAAFQDGGPLREWAYGLRRVYGARTLDREFRYLWREKRPRLDALSQVDIPTLSHRDLSHHLQEVMALHEAFWEQCGRLGDSDKLLADALSRLHARWASGDLPDWSTLLWTRDDQVTRCHEALAELAQAESASEAEREEAFASFFQEHRHLFLRGNALADWQDICALQEDESAARSLFASLRRPGPSLRQQNVTRETERGVAERQVLGRMGQARRRIYLHVLRLARRYRLLRANREEPVLLCRLLERDVVFEVGHRLTAEGLSSGPEDARFLGCREMIGWLEGTASPDEIVRCILERKDLCRRWSRYAPPKALGEEKDPPTLDVGSLAPESVLRGRPIFPGIAEGRARVIGSFTEATNVLPGEVLVCREPSFELTPLFSIVAAVVAEEGGLLEHASVPAREYGVPAVFGVKEAAQRIRTGEELFVDARRGIVVRHEPEPELEPW